MKKILLLLVAMVFSLGMQAQEKTMPRKTHLMMQDGKMWIMNEGKSTPMTEVMILNEGTLVALDGKIARKDGSTALLGEGDAIDTDGMLFKHDDKNTVRKSIKN